jgi:hypothetical protein
MQHFLYFLPLPQKQGSFLPSFFWFKFLFDCSIDFWINSSTSVFEILSGFSEHVLISLSIRELIRQGYLFGAHVLKRSLIERVIILLYLHTFPNKINLWVDGGWEYRKAPSLTKMMDEIKQQGNFDLEFVNGNAGLTDCAPECADGKAFMQGDHILFQLDNNKACVYN